MLGELGKLSSRDLTGNAAIEHLTRCLEAVSASDAKVIERIIEKDLKCGVSESTANKVWPDLIPEYPCMLASAFEQKLVDKIKFPAIVQVKMDGMRFNAIVEDGKCEFRSRNGKLIDIPSDLFAQPFIHMSKFWGIDMVFDGELLCADASGKPLDRKTGNGILNKAVKGTMSEKEAATVRAVLWDAIPLDNFIEGKYEEAYQDRLAKLFNAIDDCKGKSSLGHLLDKVWSKRVETQLDAQKLFEKFLGEGQEGIILKSKDGIWEDKRAKHQIKFKGEYECDLICVGWEEGTGKNTGRLGALQLESACGKLKVGVGSGLTDSDRENIGRDVVGKIITIKYNAIVDDKTKDTKSLFLPIFLEVREDKDTADTLDKLKG
jgi:ATP-dependent DNA ligase